MEFNWTEIVLAFIAILSGFITHQLTKNKYKMEVEKLKVETNSDTIKNMDKSLDFYEKYVAATDKRLDEVLASQEILRNENIQLKNQLTEINTKMSQLTTVICTKLSCIHREIDESVIECIYPKKGKKNKVRLKNTN